jgi:hypothetical protein
MEGKPSPKSYESTFVPVPSKVLSYFRTKVLSDTSIRKYFRILLPEVRARTRTCTAVHVLAHNLWVLDRTGVKASILTDCVGQLRFN